jgi:hypothetical protein
MNSYQQKRQAEMTALRETGIKREIERYGRTLDALIVASEGLSASIDGGEEPNPHGIDALFGLLIKEFQSNHKRLQQLI